jgi:hypothetical protein
MTVVGADHPPASPATDAGAQSAAVRPTSMVRREFLASVLRLALTLDVVIVGSAALGAAAPTLTASGMLALAASLIFAGVLGTQLSDWFLGEWAFDRDDLARIGAQVAGGVFAAAIVVVPLAVAGPGDVAERVSEPVLEGLMIVVTYAAARQAGKGRPQAVAAVLIVMTAVASLLFVRALLAS